MNAVCTLAHWRAHFAAAAGVDGVGGDDAPVSAIDMRWRASVQIII